MPTNDTNPFVGPRPLERADGKLPGRDTEIQELHWRFTAERILWLHGPSGAGKTSLLQAGLIPKLEENDFLILPTVRLNTAPTGTGNRYIASLHTSLNAIAPQGDTRCRVLIFDQFEEVLTLVPNDGPAKEEFFKELAHVLILPHIWALFIVREDYLPAFSHLARFLPTGMNHRFRLSLLSPDNARISIEAIAATSKQREFLPEASQRLASELARIRDVRTGQWVDGPTVEPVLLQVVCRTLWATLPASATKITPALVPANEDFDKVLQTFYDGCLNADPVRKFPCDERRIRQWIEDELIAGGVRNIVLESAITATDLPLGLLKALVETRLLRRESGSHTWFELAHDRLIEPVKTDNRLWREKHLSWFQKRAAVWELKGKATTFLLSDAELAEADRWIQQANPVLSDAEKQFRRESRDACNGRKRLRLLINVAWLGAILVTVAVALAITFHQQAEIRKLINQSRLVPGSPESADHAIESGRKALEKSKYLGAGLERDAIETLNEALQRRNPFDRQDASTANLQRIFYATAAKRLGVSVTSIFTLFEIPTKLSDAHTTVATWKLSQGCVIRQAVLAADGDSAYLVLSDGTVRHVDRSQSGIITCEAGGSAVTALAVSESGLIAVAHEDWTLEINKKPGLESGAMIASLAFRPDGLRLAVGDDKGNVTIYNTQGDQAKPLLKAEKAAGEAEDKSVTTLVWGKRVLVAASRSQGTVRLFDEKGKLLHEVTHTSVKDLGVEDAAVSPDGKYIATIGATDDGQTKLWPTNAPSGPVLVLQPPGFKKTTLKSVAFMGDDHLLVATTEGDILIYHLTRDALLKATEQTPPKP